MNPQSPYTPGGQGDPYQQYPPQPQAPQQAVPQAPVPGYAPIPPLSTPPLAHRRSSKKWVIMTFVFIFTTLSAGGAGTWALINYFDQRDNVDGKVDAAVNLAVKDQKDIDAAEYLEKEKQPNRQFVGPEDYGRVSFDYPKTWSLYVAKDASNGGTYLAYFNPVSVPAISTSEHYALRVTIEDKDYDKVLKSYESSVKKGNLTSSVVKTDGQDGTRLDGTFAKEFVGSAVVFKIRDKTVTIRTDAVVFKKDFDALIKTITFNK